MMWKGYRCGHGTKGKVYTLVITTREFKTYKLNVSKKCRQGLYRYCKEHRIACRFDK